MSGAGGTGVVWKGLLCIASSVGVSVSVLGSVPKSFLELLPPFRAVR